MTPADRERIDRYQRIADEHGRNRRFADMSVWGQLAACLAICGPSLALDEAEQHARLGRLVDAVEAIRRACQSAAGDPAPTWQSLIQPATAASPGPAPSLPEIWTT